MLSGIASSMTKVMRLVEDPLGADPYRREMSRRLVATIVLMDRTLSPSLNMTPYFDLQVKISEPCSEEELQSMKSGVRLDEQTVQVKLIAELLNLSHLFCRVCLFHRHGGTLEDWRLLESEHQAWRNRLHHSLVFSPDNFRRHQLKLTVRQFLYLNLLYHHICQLIYFPFLQASHASMVDMQQVANCRMHASTIVDIVAYTWETVTFEIHNVSMGQILTVSAAVQMHTCMTATSKEQLESGQTRISLINESMTRMRQYCRVYDRIVSCVTLLLVHF